MRQRVVHSMSARLLDTHHFYLSLKTQAGTYPLHQLLLIHLPNSVEVEVEICSADIQPVGGASVASLTTRDSYIKEFVHGDFGRTKPNMCELLKTDTDILELDVEVTIRSDPACSWNVFRECCSTVCLVCLFVCQSVDVDWPPSIPE